MKTKPMTMLLVMLAGWLNQQQQQIIDYLKATGMLEYTFHCEKNVKINSELWHFMGVSVVVF
jgi:hypothetical protein